MLDPALFASMTWLDWTIVGIPAVFVLDRPGDRRDEPDAVLARFALVTAIPLAVLPVAYVATTQKRLIQQLAVQVGADVPDRVDHRLFGRFLSWP